MYNPYGMGETNDPVKTRRLTLVMVYFLFVHKRVRTYREKTREKAWVYQSARPCLPCATQLMTDGCVHLLFNSSYKFSQLAAWQLLSGQPIRYGKSRRYGPSIMYKITPAGSLSLLQPARRAAVLGQPFILRPHWRKQLFILAIL